MISVLSIWAASELCIWGAGVVLSLIVAAVWSHGRVIKVTRLPSGKTFVGGAAALIILLLAVVWPVTLLLAVLGWVTTRRS